MDEIPIAGRLTDVTKSILVAGVPTRVLDTVTFDLPSQQMTALLGPSGAGKSTIVSLLAGMDQVDSGFIQLAGENLTQLNATEITAIRRKYIGMIFESDNLIPSLTIEQNLRLPETFTKEIINESNFKKITHDFGLVDVLQCFPHNVGLDIQQKVAIARALLFNTMILLCDDPVRGMARNAAREILSLLRVCVREFGMSVLITTEDPSAAAFADRVYLLSDGCVKGRIDSPSLSSVLLAMNSFGYGEE